MSFVYPHFLWALALIAIPIIIHLFYFRRYKTLYFSNVKMLNEVKEERATKNKLKHLLVLLSRIFAIVCLVLAFAQPFITPKNQAVTPQKNISIYIDNSFSMQAEGSRQILLEEAKEMAADVIQTYAKADPADQYKYHILTNDFEVKHQHLVNKTEALSFVKAIQISAATQKYSTIYQRQKSALKATNAQNYIVQLTDFQKDNDFFENDTLYNTTLVSLRSQQHRNVYIDTLWFEESVQLLDATNKMIVKIVNETDEELTGNYQFELNGKTKSVGKYSIAKKAFLLDTVNFKIDAPFWNLGKISLSDYPIQFDDAYYFSFFVEEKVNVLAIAENEKEPIFNAVFSDIAHIAFTEKNANNIDYNNLQLQHFIILNQLVNIPSGLVQALKTYVAKGGNLFIVPNINVDLNSYNMLFSALQIGKITALVNAKKQVETYHLNHYLLNDLFEKTPKEIALPVVFKSYDMNTARNGTEQAVFSYKNQQNFLSSFQFELGSVYYMNAALDKNACDFSSNALFAPVVYKMAVKGVNNNILAHTIQAQTTLSINKNINTFKNLNEEVFKMKKISDKNAVELIPQKSFFGGEVKLSIFNTALDAGFYKVFSEKFGFDDESNLLAKVALNYNRNESKLDYFSQDELEKRYSAPNISLIDGNIEAVKENIIHIDSGKQLWKWFIIFSLLFLALEILLLRFLNAFFN